MCDVIEVHYSHILLPGRGIRGRRSGAFTPYTKYQVTSIYILSTPINPKLHNSLAHHRAESRLFSYKRCLLRGDSFWSVLRTGLCSAAWIRKMTRGCSCHGCRNTPSTWKLLMQGLERECGAGMGPDDKWRLKIHQLGGFGSSLQDSRVLSRMEGKAYSLKLKAYAHKENWVGSVGLMVANNTKWSLVTAAVVRRNRMHAQPVIGRWQPGRFLL